MSIDYTSYSEDFVDEIDPVEDVENTVEDQTMMGAIYNAAQVYLRKGPDKESSPVTVLNKGDEVMIDGVEEDVLGNGWYHLITASGNEGYTMAEYVKIVE